ncbi:MAG: hypothetical protein U5J83_08755 [Bryobacterales bacterium]|nr:hypothetical protein [Bryobacterales bacterium]
MQTFTPQLSTHMNETSPLLSVYTSTQRFTVIAPPLHAAFAKHSR